MLQLYISGIRKNNNFDMESFNLKILEFQHWYKCPERRQDILFVANVG